MLESKPAVIWLLESTVIVTVSKAGQEVPVSLIKIVIVVVEEIVVLGLIIVSLVTALDGFHL